MLRDFIVNISLLVTSFFIMGRIYKLKLFSKTLYPRLSRLLAGLVFGLQGLLLLAFSINIAPSVIVDLRHLSIIVAALYGGPAAAIASAVVIAAGRHLLFGMNVSTLIAAAGVLACGAACALLSLRPMHYMYKMLVMNVACLACISFVMYTITPDKSTAFEAIGFHWSVSIPGGILALFLAHYIHLSNEAIERLEQSEERYKQLILNSPDAVLVHSGGVIRFINEKGVKLLAAESHKDIVGKPALSIIYLPNVRQAQERFQYIMENQKPLEAVEERFVRMDGKIVDVELSTSPIVYKNEPAIMTSFRDITDRKQTEYKLQEALEALQRLSEQDGLTGVGNRRSFDRKLAEEWRKNALQTSHLSLILFDVDGFKAYNDAYGHQRGDDCLKAIASTVDEMLQGSNRFLARYGGEEFAVILPDTGRQTAAAVAESVRKKVESMRIPHEYSPVGPHITISLGTASLIPVSVAGQKELVEMADRALYKAKAEGRNRIVSVP
ncbi:diguanylate cyclase [Paenibacillus hamazuiensis]|uniref:diguanylate cyclase n=1 Tax=Paenibacillus hamazuiensis TaxID=2936508 RepID=UPI00200C596A|nr:diguanylate cyclase [Paenibacillus hamazuiensis]